MPQKYRWGATLRLLLYCCLLGGLILLTQGGCSLRLPGWLEEIFTDPTPREAYYSALRRGGRPPEPTLRRWAAAHDSARASIQAVTLPHREVITTDTALAHSAQSLRFRLPYGRRLRVSLEEASGAPVFAELYRAGTERPVAAADTLDYPLDYAAEATGGEELQLVLQPPPGRGSRYDLSLVTAPVLFFPVAGADAGDIGSKWGAPRDGGRRRHEGNDVFAPRGTPLLAVAAGRVSRVREGGLGGKTVWLRDGEGRPLSYYYAHLDSQLVRTGQYLERGDTLGLVGNTGNARTTPPHLHFGIYGRSGARDPFPFLDEADDRPRAPAYQLATGTHTVRVPARGNHYLRRRPERDGPVIRQLTNGEELAAAGATGRFYRVTDSLGTRGYANFD